ncbi:GGDEF domain-containing protein [Holophaga foetida]|uniref:GGDEF domain-containing protein n=1 Tax=Holophaga foetida TaxID=35839 RepID=UPI0002472EB0|nr:sensor domain-containing diguanylate cyclase [Holophaga foetida]
MSSQEEALLGRLRTIVQAMNLGAIPVLEPLPEVEDPSLGALAADIFQMGKQYADSYTFLLDLAKGNLDAEAPSRSYWAAPYKQLQAELRHLTWQIQEISRGSLDHQVSFSGDFAQAINAMIEALREKEQLDEQNRANAQLFKTIFETSADGMLIANLQGWVLYPSRSGTEMLLLDESDYAQGVNLFDYIHPGDREKARHSIMRLLRGETTGFSEYRVLRKDGTQLWNESHAAVLTNAQGEPDRLFVVFRDITQRKADEEKLRAYSEELERLNAKLSELATTDALTGVFNRRSFDSRLQQEVQRAIRFSGCFCLVMFDIDHFKRFNDHYGHGAGDLVLVSVCGAVGLHIRQVDGLYRYGGEEFMVVLSETSLEQGLLVAENLRALVGGLELSHNDTPLPSVTASFGVCCSSEMEGLEAARLVEAVDAALYQAKASGRNCVRMARAK